jgi:hypothetical protein
MSRPIAARKFPLIETGRLRVDPDQSDIANFGVYSTGTTALYPNGTIYRDGDRAFRYARAGAAVKAGFGVKNWGQYSGVTGGNVTARAIGDDTVDILLDATTGAAAWFGTADNMVGGFYSQPDSTNAQFRMIIGHEVGASTATIWMTLDGPITRTMIATSFTELAQNPYRDVRSTGNDFSSVMGIPTTIIASGSFGWLQTWGPCWVTPNQPVADTANWRQVVFKNEGAVIGFDDATAEAGHQHAGFVIDRTSNGGDNPPFIFLQITY